MLISSAIFTVSSAKEAVMYQEIKRLAEEALRLQNKNAMDEAFKQIIAICDDAAVAAMKFAAPQIGGASAEPAATSSTAELADIEEMMSAAMTKPFEAAPREAIEALNKLASKKVRGAK